MKPKIKMVVDFIMSLSLLVLMAYAVTGGLIHEVVGTVMIILFVTHNILNFRWYKNLVKGKYNILRIVQTAVNIMLLAAITLLIISGIIMSSHVFKFLNISEGMSISRKVHMVSSHWSFILMAFHLGLHFEMIISMIKKATKIGDSSKTYKTLGKMVVGVIVVYGVYAFYKNKIGDYLFLRNSFGFFGGESGVLFFVDYAAIMGMFIFAAWSLRKIIIKSKK